MAFRKSAEEKAAEQAARDEQRFWESPQGQAKLARERGDQVFQTQIAISGQRASLIPHRGQDAVVQQSAGDVSAELNRICAEGWELISASTTFVQTGSVSTDKVIMSGQTVAVHGNVLGFYVFKRRG